MGQNNPSSTLPMPITKPVTWGSGQRAKSRLSFSGNLTEYRKSTCVNPAPSAPPGQTGVRLGGLETEVCCKDSQDRNRDGGCSGGGRQGQNQREYNLQSLPLPTYFQPRGLTSSGLHSLQNRIGWDTCPVSRHYRLSTGSLRPMQ